MSSTPSRSQLSTGRKSIRRSTRTVTKTYSSSPSHPRLSLRSSRQRSSVYRPTNVKVLEDQITKTLISTKIIKHPPRVVCVRPMRTSKSSENIKRKLQFWGQEALKSTGLDVIKERKPRLLKNQNKVQRAQSARIMTKKRTFTPFSIESQTQKPLMSSSIFPNSVRNIGKGQFFNTQKTARKSHSEAGSQYSDTQSQNVEIRSILSSMNSEVLKVQKNQSESIFPKNPRQIQNLTNFSTKLKYIKPRVVMSTLSPKIDYKKIIIDSKGKKLKSNTFFSNNPRRLRNSHSMDRRIHNNPVVATPNWSNQNLTPSGVHNPSGSIQNGLTRVVHPLKSGQNGQISGMNTDGSNSREQNINNIGSQTANSKVVLQKASFVTAPSTNRNYPDRGSSMGEERLTLQPGQDSTVTLKKSSERRKYVKDSIG